jgi:hypothetical protein
MPSALLIALLQIGTKKNEKHKENENENFVKDIREAFTVGIRLKDIFPSFTFS